MQFKPTLRSALATLSVAVGLSLLSAYELSAQSVSVAKSPGGGELGPAVADIKAGQHKRAIKKLSGAISSGGLKGGNVAKALYYRGKAYHAVGKHGQAIADLTNATFLNGLSSAERQDALAVRAQAYKSVGVAARGGTRPTQVARSVPKATPRAAPVAAGRTSNVRTIAQAPAPKLPDPVREPAPTSSGGFFSNLFGGGSSSSGKPVSIESLSEDPEESKPPKRIVTARAPVAQPRPVASPPSATAVAPQAQAPKARVVRKAPAPAVAPAPAPAASSWSTNVNRSTGAANEPSSSGGLAGFFGGLFGGNSSTEQQGPDTSQTASVPKAPTVARPAPATRPAGRTRVAALPKQQTVRKRPTKAAAAKPVGPVSEPLVREEQRKPVVSGGTVIQVASLRSQGEALRVIRSLNRSLPTLTAQARPAVDQTVIGNMGTFYRVTLGPFASSNAGKQACAEVRTKGMDCFILTN